MLFCKKKKNGGRQIKFPKASSDQQETEVTVTEKILDLEHLPFERQKQEQERFINIKASERDG